MRFAGIVAAALLACGTASLAATPFSINFSTDQHSTVTQRLGPGYGSASYDPDLAAPLPYTAGPMRLDIIGVPNINTAASFGGTMFVGAEVGGVTLSPIGGGAFDLTSIRLIGVTDLFPIVKLLVYNSDNSAFMNGGTTNYDRAISLTMPTRFESQVVELDIKNASAVSFFMGMGQFAVDDIVGVSGVPEPATWTLSLAGFGLVGGVMRRRGRVSVSYA